MDWLDSEGYITLLAGETGAGKSTVLADVTARVTTGHRGRVSMNRASRARPMAWQRRQHRRNDCPRLVACGGNLNHVIEIQGVTQQGKRNTFSMQDDLGEIRRWLTAARDEGFPFAMLVIDPVTSYLPGQKLRKVDLNDGATPHRPRAVAGARAGAQHRNRLRYPLRQRHHALNAASRSRVLLHSRRPAVA